MLRVLFILIGLLLACTALAKLHLLLADPFADVRTGLPKEVLWLGVLLEAGVAILHFRLADRRLLVVLDLVLFAAFAAFSGARWLLGYRSCGCSGVVELPVWFFPLLDVGLVAALWMASRPLGGIGACIGHAVSTWRTLPPQHKGRLAGAGLFAAALAAMQLPVAAPLRGALLGEPSIVARVVVPGPLAVGREEIGQVELWNRSAWPARVVGVSRSCRCFDFREDQAGLVLPAHSHTLRDLVVRPRQPGPLHQRVELYLDHPEQFRVKVDLVGSVKGE